MKNRIPTAAALALAAALMLSGCAPGADADPDTMPGMHHGDDAGSEQAADVNSADIMFAQMMIPHHEQAVEMADMLLAKDDIDPDVVRLAEDIKAAQQPEIDRMAGWLEDWGADMPGMDGMDGMDHGDGMMSEADMARLEAATGVEASRLFLEQMIVHHEGAIEMAQAEVEDGRNPGAIQLADDIIETQTAEVGTMNGLLDDLAG
ncbi:DUF305 domain-containing protein [Microbacterium sp. NPDC057407]|uniref:DUF305 domain-containing protein n=1 Tax=Microbacterium sp. NPDC057407 TaxID=3346120 RepID=UPI00366DC290